MRRWQRHETNTEAAIYLNNVLVYGKIRNFSGGGAWFEPLHNHNLEHVQKCNLNEPISIKINLNNFCVAVIRKEVHKNYNKFGLGIKFINPLFVPVGAGEGSRTLTTEASGF